MHDAYIFTTSAEEHIRLKINYQFEVFSASSVYLYPTSIEFMFSCDSF